MTIDTELSFGKYSGMTPRELIKNNKGIYLMWCLENIKSFTLEPKSLEDAIRRQYGKQYIIMCKNKKQC